VKKLILIIIAGVLIYSCENNQVNKNQVKKEISQASDFKLEMYNFNEFQGFLKKQDNKIYVLNFWATWCAPCIKELPYFEELNKKYKDDNVEVILDWIPKVDESWTGSIPATVIYNSKKSKFYERSFTYEELEKEVNGFLIP